MLAELAEKQPIIIFIDELDRCRPNFAVQMLEVVKHTLTVTGLKFVFITNTQQLRASINHCYGDDVDAQRYLDKFIKFSFQLPSIILPRQRYGAPQKLASVAHFSALAEKSSILCKTYLINKPHERELVKFIHSLISINNLSLREVETFSRYLEVYYHIDNGLSDDNIFGYKLICIFSVYIFCFSPKIVNAIQCDNSDAEPIAVLLGVDTLLNMEDRYYLDSPTDVIGMLLTQASMLNKEKYQLPEMAQKNLNQSIYRYFNQYQGSGDNHPFHHYDAFDKIKQVITILSLGGSC
jgi:hypothetical protein